MGASTLQLSSALDPPPQPPHRSACTQLPRSPCRFVKSSLNLDPCPVSKTPFGTSLSDRNPPQTHTFPQQVCTAVNGSGHSPAPGSRDTDVRWQHSVALGGIAVLRATGSRTVRGAGYSTVVPGQVSDRAPDDASDAGLIDTTLSQSATATLE